MRIFIVSIIAVFSIILGSCDHRELCYDHEHWIDLEVGFDWTAAPESNPVTMVVWFFPEAPDAEGGPRSYEFGGKNGGSIRIPAGNYRAICFNGGTETLLERGSSFEDFHITTDTQDILGPMNRSMDVTPRPKPGKDEDVKQAPETLWSAQLTEFKLSGCRQPKSYIQADRVYTQSSHPYNRSGKLFYRHQRQRSHDKPFRSMVNIGTDRMQ